jgi:hypothetical protein
VLPYTVQGFVGTNITPLMAVGTNVTVQGTLVGATTIFAPLSPVIGQRLRFLFTADGTSRAITWNAVFKFYSAPYVPSGANTLSTAITFEYDGANWIQQAPNVWA